VKMKLETERLILRKPKESDWKDLVEGVGNIEVSRNLELVGHPYRKKDGKDFIEYALKEWRKKKKEKYIFFIELKSEKKVIGVTEVSIKKNIGESGSWINKNYWKKGYITEAKTAVNYFAFNKLGARKLESGAIKENKASNIMQTKMGYKLEGCLRQKATSKATGKIHDLNVYGLLKNEWKKSRPKVVKKLKEKIKRLENK
jgi:[ribosomal protein S5]-alanine N-acetyltransferase